MAFPAATAEESMLPACDGRAGKTLNRKSDSFPFQKLNDFESRNGGREKDKDTRRGWENFSRKSEGFDIGREKAFSAATAEEKKLRVHD